jgi:hypothetical protein
VSIALPALAPVRRRMIAAWIAALGFGACAFQVADYCARTLPQRAPFEELAYYPSGHALRPVALGHTETAADLAWLRAVQYYGEHRTTDLRFIRLEHVFGAFSMAQEGRDFAAAERLLLKGMEHNPRSGRLAFELGFLYYVRPGGRDLPRAGEYFERAARLPGGPPNAGRFAAYALQHAGDLAVALQLWSEVRETTDNRYLREMADKEMQRIQQALATGRRGLAVKRLTTPTVILQPS